MRLENQKSTPVAKLDPSAVHKSNNISDLRTNFHSNLQGPVFVDFLHTSAVTSERQGRCERLFAVAAYRHTVLPRIREPSEFLRAIPFLANAATVAELSFGLMLRKENE